MTDRKITIHGLSGWKRQDPAGQPCEWCKAHPEANKDDPSVPVYACQGCGRLFSPAGYVPPPGAPDLSTPEARLAAMQEAARRGDIALAEENRGGFVIQWSMEGYGFGELTVWTEPDGKIVIDDECTHREKLQAILLAVLAAGETLSERAEKKGAS